jgi:transposase
MEITEEQFARIEPSLPRQRGNVSHESIAVINAILYMAESGCTWRNLPKRFGNWHTIYTRVSRWAKAGVLDMVFEKLQREQLIRIRIEAACASAGMVRIAALESASAEITGRTPLENPLEDGPPKLIWLPRLLGTR